MKVMIRFLMCFLLMLIGDAVYSQEWFSVDGSPKGDSYTVEVMESNETVYKVRVKIHGLLNENVIEDDKVFHHISFDTGGKQGAVGQPELPMFSRLLAIPENTIVEPSIIESSWTDINIGKIYPSQKPLKESEVRTSFELDEETYNVNSYLPKLVSVGDYMYWRGVRNAPVNICPFRYYPQEGRLSVLHDFTLQVKFSPTSKKLNTARKNSRVEKEDYLKLFDNSIPMAYADEYPSKSTILENTNDYIYDYLIIVGQGTGIMGSQPLKDFQSWKAFKGFKTKAVSTDTTGQTCTSIKNYIYQECNNHGIKYVLFVGDDDQIPQKFIDFQYYNDTTNCDYWYSCIDNDNMADIALGRFPTNSLTEFKYMVDKTIKYEKNYASDNNVLLIAHKEDAPNKYQKCCEDIRTANYVEPMSFFTAYGASGSTNSQVVYDINNGVHITNYRGHGMKTGWGFPHKEWNTQLELFTDSEINNLNDSTCSVYFSIACETGQIKYGTCMLETFLRSPHGAVSFLGATEETYTIANHRYNIKLFDTMLNDSIYNIGKINQSALIKNLNMGYNAKFNAFCSILGGDPTLEIWTATPSAITVTEVSSTAEEISLTTNLIDGFSVSVVSENGELLEKVETTGSQCAIQKPSAKSHIVINKHNCYPYFLVYEPETSHYIQDEIFTQNTYYDSTPIYIGYDVTTEKDFGVVVIKDGVSLKIKNGTGGVTIKNGFECEKGGEIEIK